MFSYLINHLHRDTYKNYPITNSVIESQTLDIYENEQTIYEGLF